MKKSAKSPIKVLFPLVLHVQSLRWIGWWMIALWSGWKVFFCFQWRAIKKTIGLDLRFSDDEESLFTLAGEYRDRKLAIFESTRTKEKAFQTSRYSTGWTSGWEMRRRVCSPWLASTGTGSSPSLSPPGLRRRPSSHPDIVQVGT